MTTKTMTTRHPARYTDALLPVFAQMVSGARSILDPMAGTGKIFSLRDYGVTAQIHAIELEAEWAALHPETMVGNALCLPFANDSIDCVITSPTYANRMADHHDAKDDSRRNTYRHALGRCLHPDNSGSMQWGERYRLFHNAAWLEVYRVLCPDGAFVLNIKDHIRKGERVRVTDWHVEALQGMGFSVAERVEVACPGNRFGQNGNARIDYESVIKFHKSEVRSG
jgi:hypothetical protein